MKLGWRQAILSAAGITVLCLFGVGFVGGQTAPAAVPMAEQVFTNVQVLKGIPVDEFMDTMGFLAASLNLNCTDCHTSESAGDWKKYADDTPLKQKARMMILMVTNLNRASFGGQRMVTCWTCHRGGQRPQVNPSLLEQYSAPPPEDPNEYQILDSEGMPSVDQIFDKYIAALGGAQKLAALTSFVGKGTYEGYDTDHEQIPVEVYNKAPGMRTTVVHLHGADSVRTTDGKMAWVASPDKPVPLMTLTGNELDGAKLDAMMAFPSKIKDAYPNWKVGQTLVEDKDVYVVQGSAAGKMTIKLYFDQQSGLLVRLARFDNTMVGVNTVEVDYTDYRPVAEVKVPFQYKMTWTGGQDTVIFSDVQPNVAIDASRFATPAPAKLF